MVGVNVTPVRERDNHLAVNSVQKFPGSEAHPKERT